MLKLDVNASKNYTVTIDDGFKNFSQIKDIFKNRKIAIICDKTVKSLYGNELKRQLKGEEFYFISIPSGEQSKTLKNYCKLINKFAELSFTRKDVVITFGGGVVGDLGAFVASTYMRGITLIAIPTTILSAVDSSVGGKTAVDLNSGKNMCGTFYQPSAVYINVDFLKTLPNREILSGYGEIIKYAMLSKSLTLDDIKSQNLELIIYKCLSIKKDIVEKDERESSLRMLLNLGHTFGHAVETLSNFTLSHGECVVIGLKYVIEFSKKYYNLRSEVVNKLNEILVCMGHNLNFNYSINEVVEKINADKKRESNFVNLVTLKDVGCPQIEKIEIESLKNYF